MVVYQIGCQPPAFQPVYIILLPAVVGIVITLCVITPLVADNAKQSAKGIKATAVLVRPAVKIPVA